jgi:hypothetical protein
MGGVMSCRQYLAHGQVRDLPESAGPKVKRISFQDGDVPLTGPQSADLDHYQQ